MEVTLDELLREIGALHMETAKMARKDLAQARRIAELEAEVAKLSKQGDASGTG